MNLKKSSWVIFFSIVLMALLLGCSSRITKITKTSAYPEKDYINVEISFDNNLYTLEEFKVPIEYIGDELGQTMVQVKDEKRNCKIYQISNISKSYAVILEYDNNDYYICANFEYEPENYGEWIEALHLNDNLTINNIEFHNEITGNVTDLEKNVQNNFRQSLLELPPEIQSYKLLNPVSELEKSDDWISISADVDILGVKNHSISIYSTGYLVTNITYGEQSFYIGEEQYRLLRNYFQSK